MSAGIEQAFKNNDGVMRCMDDRTPKGIHAAGSGLLIGDHDFSFSEDDEKQVAFLKAVDAKTLTRHRGCGAEAAWAKVNGKSGEQAEEYFERRAQAVAKKLEIPYQMIEFSDMAPYGSSDKHETAVVYFDGTGAFDYTNVENLPIGFIVVRDKVRSSEYSLAEATFAAKIVFGHHGVGEQWLRENSVKLTLVAIGSKEFPVDQLKTELHEVVALNPGLIQISTIDATNLA